MSEKVHHVNLRLPPDVHEAAVQLAKQQRRSLNGLFLALVEQAIKDAKRKTR